MRNKSDVAGAVEIRAIDDTGQSFGPVTLDIAAGQTAPFNSDDLELGNQEKGLFGGVGDGEGHWRLELDTTLDLEVRGYLRTPDGFVTSIHQLAERAPGTERRYLVPFFNGASNQRVRSMLRIINPNTFAVDVTLEAWDFAGESGEDVVAFSIEAGAAVLVSSQQLESGNDTFDGRLGDGVGKWRFELTAEGAKLEVMSLLSTNTGHLTNMSR